MSDNKPRKKFEGPKKEAILDLAQYKDCYVRVKLAGGKVVTGKLKGYDPLMNLVLEDATECAQSSVTDNTTASRKLGLTVVRGTILVSISPLRDN